MPKRKQAVMQPGKYALALSGGGAAGAWLPGAMSAFYEIHKLRDFPVIYGTSTGSLYGTLLALYQATGDTTWFFEGENIYRGVNNADILSMRSCLAKFFGDDAELFGLAASIVKGENSIFSIEPLAKLIDRFVSVNDWQLLIDSDTVELGFVCFNMQLDRVEIFTNQDEGMTPEKLRLSLLASASQPVLMPPILIGEYQYIDGGLGAVTPAELVYGSISKRSDLQGVIALDLEQYGPSPNNEIFEANVDILLRTIEILAGRVYDTNVDETYLRQQIDKTRVPLYRFRPSPPAKIGSLNFNTKQMNALVRRGFKNIRDSVVVDRSLL